MALFDKLFSLKRRLDSEKYCESIDRGRSRQIDPEQVRLLLFKECDWRGRKLLFDSSTIQKVPAGKHDKPQRRVDETPCIVEVSDGYSYVYKGPEADANVLGEMIFGAVAMNYKNVSLKIHIMDEPRRLMCTEVFCVPTARGISNTERKTDSSSSVLSSNVTSPLKLPSFSDDGVALSFSMDRGDSGFCDHSSYSSVGSTLDYFSMIESWDGSSSQDDFYSFHSPASRKLSASSNGSWQRRTFQNFATRFQLGQNSQLLSVPTDTTTDSQVYSNSSTSVTSDSLASGASVPQRKNKLGIAVLITVNDSDQLDIIRKCVEHCPQVQSLVCRVRASALRAGLRGKFVAALHSAATDAARWLSELLYGPRLQPLWLRMVTSDPSVTNKLADGLLADLCSVLAVADTKTTNFFISTLLTHVLTYHLGWVTTVSPYDTIEHQKTQPSSEAKKPYNALWAQLSDLCGSIGFPPRTARTIISGEKNTQFVNRLLTVLTYFLRCGDVKRTVFQYQESVFKETRTVTVSKPEPSGLKRTATRVNKLVDCDNLPVEVNTQNSDSVSTLVPSEVSLKKTATLGDLTRKLSSSADVGGSCSGEKPTLSPLRRNPTMLSSLKASSDSSLNSSVSDDLEPEQKVVFVLGDDEKLVGLKNKSINGKSVKKSSKVHNEPVVLEPQAKETCENKQGVVRNTESPSKCCEQTLQHSKPIKHSGFKFEFDKYPQIVTNYMKSKNLEILDRHYIGKPGNLKLDNFQFDPTVVPPIQEEKCETCVKCQMMEVMLQTPTNASEMECMNDMPQQLEPQFARETVVSGTEPQHREMSPKTFVRRRKENVVIVNLVKNMKSAAVSRDEVETTDRTSVTEGLEGLVEAIDKTESKENLLSEINSKNLVKQIENPEISVQYVSSDPTESNIQSKDTILYQPPLKSNKLKFTKSTNNLNSLFCVDDSFYKTENQCKKPLDYKNSTVGSNVSVISESHLADGSNLSTNGLSKAYSFPSTLMKSSNDLKSRNDLSITLEMERPTNLETNSDVSAISSKDTINPLERQLRPDIEVDRTRKAKKPLSLEEQRDRAIEVKTVTEFLLPQLRAKTDISAERCGFDGSLLGGVTEHYVPDLILQGTLAKPASYECSLRRDLDIAAYLSKQLDSPAHAVAIIGDTNTWEVRVVGRECGTGGMSSLVGAMLEALPAMWRAKVPAHHCLSFLEGKLREFCVLSKTLADMLMSTDFCDIATLAKSLNIDVNDVPLLLAVATTHTPQVATRYGISYM